MSAADRLVKYLDEKDIEISIGDLQYITADDIVSSVDSKYRLKAISLYNQWKNSVEVGKPLLDDVIDLSGKYITDSELCDKLNRCKLDGKILDLSFNYISCRTQEQQKYMTMLIDRCSKVILVSNPVASVDGTAYLTHLHNKDKLHKVIWIPNSWLRARGWENVLPSLNDDQKKIVLKTHLGFYGA